MIINIAYILILFMLYSFYLLYFDYNKYCIYNHYLNQKYKQIIYYLFYNYQFKKLQNNSDKISIILTCTVNINNNISVLKLKDSNKRKRIYINAIRNWLKNTNFNIIVVENSNYNFKELEFEKLYYKNRFEILSYEGDNKIKHNKSKGIHELFAINYAFENSKFIKSSKFFVKITGRYYIDKFESFINSIDIDNYYALRQYNDEKCEIVGVNAEYFPIIFSKEVNINKNIITEYLFQKRIDKLPKNRIIKCPIFKIKPTINGGYESITEYL